MKKFEEYIADAQKLSGVKPEAEVVTEQTEKVDEIKALGAEDGATGAKPAKKVEPKKEAAVIQDGAEPKPDKEKRAEDLKKFYDGVCSLVKELNKEAY